MGEGGGGLLWQWRGRSLQYFRNCPIIQIFWTRYSDQSLTLYRGSVKGRTDDRYLLKICSVAARNRKWLQTNSSLIENWREVMDKIHDMENLTLLYKKPNTTKDESSGLAI